MFVSDARVAVSDARRLRVEVLFLNHLVRIIDIQLEVRHYGQMIPKDMLEVVDISKVRKHVSHDGDYAVGTAFALIFVFYRDAIVYHIVDVASIFRKRQLLLFGVIFHCHIHVF
jgi:hypothetical protein